MLYLKLLEKMNLKLNRMNGVSLFEHLALSFGDVFSSRGPHAASDHLMNLVSTSVAKNKELYQWAVAAFLSYVRSYTSYYKDTRYVFHAKNLRLDHVKRMYGLSEKATFLLKQKPRVGKIVQKLNMKKNVKSDLQQEIHARSTSSDENVGMATSSRDNLSKKVRFKDDGDDNDANDRDKDKTKKKTTNIITYLDRKRAKLEQTTRKLPPIRLPDDVRRSESYRDIMRHRESMKYSVPVSSFSEQHLYGRVQSKSQRNKLTGETIEGTDRDQKKKRKFTEHLEKSFLVKGRTSVPEKMVNRNPFDTRGQNHLFHVMTGLTSEFDASIEEPRSKKRKTRGKG